MATLSSGELSVAPNPSARLDKPNSDCNLNSTKYSQSCYYFRLSRSFYCKIKWCPKCVFISTVIGIVIGIVPVCIWWIFIVE